MPPCTIIQGEWVGLPYKENPPIALLLGGSENTKLIFEPSDAVSDQLEHFPAVPAFGINRELIVD